MEVSGGDRVMQLQGTIPCASSSDLWQFDFKSINVISIGSSFVSEVSIDFCNVVNGW